MSTATTQLIRVDRRTTPGRPDEGLSLAERLNVSNKTAWRLVRDGKVRSYKVAGRRLVDATSADEYLASVVTGYGSR